MTDSKPNIAHLFRPVNLLIIVLTMYLLRWGLLIPLLSFVSDMVDTTVVTQITEFQFGLLVLSVVLIAMGGNIINDIKDVRVDKINGNANPVDTLISSDMAYRLYQITTVSGILVGFLIGHLLGNYNLGVIQLTAAISLWFYSYYFKNEFVIGNLVIAFVVALVPLTTGIYEVSLIQMEYFNTITNFKDFNFNFVAFWFVGYAIFAFLLTWAREILKDIEDIQGDRQIGARTLPIKLGVKRAQILVTIIYAIVIYGLVYVKLEFLTDNISFAFIAFLSLLMVANTVSMWLKKDILFSLSSWNKIYSVIGILYLVALGYMLINKLMIF